MDPVDERNYKETGLFRDPPQSQNKRFEKGKGSHKILFKSEVSRSQTKIKNMSIGISWVTVDTFCEDNLGYV